MAIINLKNGYFIQMESMCYVLKQRYEGKDRDGKPKEATRDIGYFGKMKNLINRYLKEIVSDTLDGEEMELKEYAERVDQAVPLAVQSLDKVLSEFPIK